MPQHVLELLPKQVSDLKMLLAGSQRDREMKEGAASTLGPTSGSLMAKHPSIIGAHVVHNKTFSFFFFL